MGVHDFETKSEFEAKVFNTEDDKLMVLDCFATWLDVDQIPDAAKELGIRGMPSFMFFRNGDKIDEVVGANPAAIENRIKKHTGRDDEEKPAAPAAQN
ncbi:hypothetical protein FGG08_007286 [Glutinoglossum americanum]|uniref:Thioredoxin domain-containing protein n=1 Tax=Glutinoglossum americanum TaxID=1670608 RepID=A0A9P8I3N6_9PEZI|nr:hypothetical protein FGG08_007286 [Glutinoglossum americanum]